MWETRIQSLCWKRFPGEGNGNPLQYSCLENSMHRILGGYSPWRRKELDRTEQLTLSLCYYMAVQYLPVRVFIHPYHFSPIDKHLDYFFFFCLCIQSVLGFSGVSVVKNSPIMQVMQVQSLGWEEPLEKEMATHSSILAWEIPWTEKPGGATVHGVRKSQTLLSD